MQERAWHVSTVDALAKDGAFYGSAFDLWAGVSHFIEIPVPIRDGTTYARAFLAQEGQDVGPFPPSVAYIFIEKGDQALIARTSFDDMVAQIPQCEAEWNGHMQGVYDIDIDNLGTHLYGAFSAYRSCFAEEVKNEPFYPSLEKEVQAVAARMQL